MYLAPTPSLGVPWQESLVENNDYAFGLVNPQKTLPHDSLGWGLTLRLVENRPWTLFWGKLLHQTAYCEQSIIIADGIESQLIDLMNETLQKYPEIKIFSLPKLKPNRQIELGAKGVPEQVKLAMQDLKVGVSKIGFAWREFT